MLRQVRACRTCLENPIGAPLPHEPRPVLTGRASARVMICGQAPGIRVHRSGLPFDDPSGDRLRTWLGVSRSEFYDEDRVAVVPMGFCFPGYDGKGADLPPRRECAPLWRERVLAGFPHVALRLLIGSCAIRWHASKEASAANEGLSTHVAPRSMTEAVRDWRAHAAPDAGGVVSLPLPHPSWRNSGWLKANPWFAAEVLPEVQRHVRALLHEPLERNKTVLE